MTVTVADIDRWDAGDVREVFHATRSRAEAAFEAADGIAELPAFGTWGGGAAEAAKETIAQTRRDLDAHGNEALAVAQAAATAADGIDAVKSSLAQLRSDAASAGFEIDPVAGQVLPGPALESDMIAMLAAEATRQELQARLAGILAEAAGVDRELTRAIAMATGAEPIPDGPHSNDPAVQAMLSDPPEDLQQFHDGWEKLTDEQKDWLYEQNPFIGNHPGMPFEDRDIYNRRHLPELTASAQAEVDRIAAEHPGWADGPPVAANPRPPAYLEWKDRLEAANRRLDGLRAVDAELRADDGAPRYLGLLDDQGRAAVSIGNPDTASHTATFVPGTGQDLARLPYSTEDAEAMYQAALQANPALRPEDLSVTTWMGYDRPMNLAEAGSPDFARDGGSGLAAFQEGLRVTHEGAPSVNTVVGHSYGSTLVGAAASGGNELAVDNVIAVGSPGMLVDNAGELNLGAGADVYATRARFDPINLATGFTLGPSPTADAFGAIELQAAAGPTTGPPILDLPSVAAHSSYWDPGNPALRNMGSIIAGMAPPHLAQPGG